MNILEKSIRAIGGVFNERLLAYFKNYGATSNVLQDAEKEYLKGKGLTFGANQDAWKQLDGQYEDIIPLEVSDILKKYNATMLLPGVSGAMRFGYQPGNYLESTGNTLAAADQQVGLVVDAARVPGPELVAGNNLSGFTNSQDTTHTNTGFTTTNIGGRGVVLYGLVVNKTYEIVVSGNTTSAEFSVNTANAAIPTTRTLIHTGFGRAIFKADYTYLYLRHSDAATSSNISISVRELPGIHASQSTSGFQPVLRNTAGIQSWQFDGADDRLSLSAVPFQTQDASFAVAAFSPAVMDSALRRVWEIGGNGSSIALTVDSGTFRFLRVGNTGSLVNITAGVFGGAGVSSVVSVVSAGAFSSIRADGLQKASSVIAVEQSTANIASIGNRGAGDRPFLGHIHGVIFGNGAITDSELLTLERFMASLQGRTL